ncbi:uncharacterized protein LOC134448600 isoform X2 [Engraulis encrasicolus]|uniref:uncharacterized protein LOC134448600 isoform X2 n=1 Tax=Engraulis encrasicolus TaxID=184585 RepID=UPI002FD475FF
MAIRSDFIFQALTVVVVFLGVLDAAPLQSQLECEGYIQLDGNVTYIFPDDFPDLMADCEPEILIAGKVSVIFENGKVPPATELYPPAIAVTAHNVTLSSNQSSNPQPVEIALYCPESRKRIRCFCDACLNSAKNHIPMTEPPSAEHSSPGTPDNIPHYRVGAMASGVVVVVFVLCGIFAWIAMRRRNSTEKKEGTSASSSTEQLHDPQGPPEAAPIMGHNEHRGT